MRVLLEHYVYFTSLEVRHLTDEVHRRDTHNERRQRDSDRESRGRGGRHKEEEPTRVEEE